MSAAENKQLMQEIFARVAEGDGSLFVEHLADDVVIRVSGQYSWSQTFKGKEAALRDSARIALNQPREQHVLPAPRFRRISRLHAAVP